MCLGTGQREGGRRLPWTNKRRDPSFLAVVVKGERMLRFLLVGQENFSTSDFEDHFFFCIPFYYEVFGPILL